MLTQVRSTTSSARVAWPVLHDSLPALRAFFMRRVQAHEVEDMLQDVAVRLQACPRSDEIGNAKAYLFRVARSVITDRARRETARHGARHESLTEAHYPVEDICPARVLEAKEQLSLVLEALQSLPDRTRTVFILHRFERESQTRIAEQLGISVSAVEKHMMKAMKHLTARLDD